MAFAYPRAEALLIAIRRVLAREDLVLSATIRSVFFIQTLLSYNSETHYCVSVFPLSQCHLACDQSPAFPVVRTDTISLDFFSLDSTYEPFYENNYSTVQTDSSTNDIDTIKRVPKKKMDTLYFEALTSLLTMYLTNTKSEISTMYMYAYW
jgi:hypothetical protein